MLYLDCETTGLIYPHSMPKIVSLAWAVNDEEIHHYLIKPTDYIIPKTSTRIHGITHEQALQDGEDIDIVLNHLRKDLNRVSEIIAHNADFDVTVLESLDPTLFNNKIITCSMLSTIDYCNLPRKKWPKLLELHRKVFGEEFQGRLHDASEDVRCLRQCWTQLQTDGCIVLE
jgi:DNA polymerase III epsilon subunit-like protein